MIIVMLGAPGAGKGTVGKALSTRTGINYITTGDAFRKIMQEDTELGKEIKKCIEEGKLVPDDLAIRIFEERILPRDINEDMILDGYPRTEVQAEHFDELLQKNNLKISWVINIDTPKELIIDRVVNRRICSKCNEIYNLKYGKKPHKEEICDNCGAKLIQRSDDNEKTIRDRLNTYELNTKPLIEYYTKQDKLKNIISDENTNINELVEKVINIIK